MGTVLLSTSGLQVPMMALRARSQQRILKAEYDPPLDRMMLMESKVQRLDFSCAQNHSTTSRRVVLGKLARRELLATYPDCSEIDRHHFRYAPITQHPPVSVERC